ncbi:MAG: MOSC N-terminal beta barrel domain-containing protein [Myxococcota bacterium]
MSAGRLIGRVVEIHRHPVKSMGGERVEETPLALRYGVAGDRAWAIRDVAAGEIRGAKKIPALLGLAARYVVPPSERGAALVEIDLGDGQRVRSDAVDASARLSDRLGRAVELCARRPADDLAHYRRARPITDPESEIREASELLPEESLPAMDAPPPVDLSVVGEYVAPPGTYFDFFDLHLVSTGSLGRFAALVPGSKVEARRFRPNLVVELEAPRSAEGGARSSGASAASDPIEPDAGADWPELAWVGRVLAIGGAELELTMPMMRCGMTTHAQPGLPKDPRIMRALVRDCGMNLGAGVTVRRAGRVRVGDGIRVVG